MNYSTETYQKAICALDVLKDNCPKSEQHTIDFILDALREKAENDRLWEEGRLVVLHGRWESFTTSAYIGSDDQGEPRWADRRFFVHKQCGRRSAIKEKYCPLCGAKMDLEE